MTYLTRMDLAVGGVLERVFRLRRRYQPVDMAHLLLRTVKRSQRRTLETTYVANSYLVQACPDDLERLEPIRAEILADLEQVVRDYLERQGLVMVGPLRLDLEPSPALAPGQVRVQVGFHAEE